jgi:hypothetical protein
MATSSSALASPGSTPHIVSASASPMPSSSCRQQWSPQKTPSSKKTSPELIAVAVVVSIVVVAALAAVTVLFQEIKHYSPKAPVVTDYFTEEEGHGLGLESQEVCSMHPGYTKQSQVYALI